MTLYLAYCHDRHIDPVLAAFTQYADAEQFVQKFMADHMAHPEGIRRRIVPGFSFYLAYEYESDHAFVVKVELDSEANGMAT